METQILVSTDGFQILECFRASNNTNLKKTPPHSIWGFWLYYYIIYVEASEQNIQDSIGRMLEEILNEIINTEI